MNKRSTIEAVKHQGQASLIFGFENDYCSDSQVLYQQSIFEISSFVKILNNL